MVGYKLGMTKTGTISTPLWRVVEEEGRTQIWLGRRLAELMDRDRPFDPAQISRWVQGVHVPEEATQRAFAHALCRPVETIAFGVRRPDEGEALAA